MCGIVGFVDKTKEFSRVEQKQIGFRMLEHIEHRGRDSRGVYIDKNVFLGHNRLAIICMGPSGEQPVVENNKALSYNGEFYNFKEVRDELGLASDVESDTVTLFHVLEREGISGLKRVRGMFAFSYLDRKKQEVILAVDPFAIKPLYIYEDEKWFAWSSEVKSFRGLPGVSITLNEEALAEYGVFRTIFGEGTLYKNITKISGGTYMVFDLNKGKGMVRRYLISDEAAFGSKDGLEKSVDENLIADVPVGIQLSGGVDSSLLAVLASKSKENEQLHTFSIGLKDNKWNEFEFSSYVANQINSVHHQIVFSEMQFCEELPLVTYHMDEPVSYPNTVPIRILCREAKKYVSVLLSGEGADELFGGYRRYCNFAECKAGKDILFSNSFLSLEATKEMFVLPEENVFREREKLVVAVRENSPTQKIRRYDIGTFLPSLLLRQDKMGMAETLETRFPFLDMRLYNYAMAIPDEMVFDKHNTKILLKKEAEDYLDGDFVYRRKCGFGLPISSWLKNKGGLGKYLRLFGEERNHRAIYNYPYVQKKIEEHVSGEKDNSEMLWILISLEVWIRVCIEGESPDLLWDAL